MLDHLIAIAFDWAVRSFKIEQMNNPGTRALRVGEESTELMQACEVPRETAHLMIDRVYDRAVGEVPQEIGGVLMTIFLFVAGLGHRYGSNDPIHYFVKELRRVLAKPPKHFADRNAEKIALGLDVQVTNLNEVKRTEQEAIRDFDEALAVGKGDH